jgi:hypothetical protein
MYICLIWLSLVKLSRGEKKRSEIVSCHACMDPFCHTLLIMERLLNLVMMSVDLSFPLNCSSLCFDVSHSHVLLMSRAMGLCVHCPDAPAF